MPGSDQLDDLDEASGLCASCGLCCNGVLFHTVRILGNDSISELSALGLRVWRKKGERVLLQPCPAFCGDSCRIYEQRPTRCRLFECRQLQRVKAGQIPISAAQEKIRQATTLVAEAQDLLAALGEKHLDRPLTKRHGHIESEPLDPSSDPLLVSQRTRLNQVMSELAALLDNDFRVE